MKKSYQQNLKEAWAEKRDARHERYAEKALRSALGNKQNEMRNIEYWDEGCYDHSNSGKKKWVPHYVYKIVVDKNFPLAKYLPKKLEEHLRENDRRTFDDHYEIDADKFDKFLHVPFHKVKAVLGRVALAGALLTVGDRYDAKSQPDNLPLNPPASEVVPATVDESQPSAVSRYLEKKSAVETDRSPR